MTRKLFTAVSLLLIACGAARAQDLPSPDTAPLQETFTLPNLTDAAGRTPERIGGDTQDSALFSPSVGYVASESVQYSAGSTSVVDATSEGALRSSQGAAGGAAGSATSVWTTTGFVGGRAVPPRNQRFTDREYTRSDPGSRSSISGRAGGRALPFGQQMAAGQTTLQGTTLPLDKLSNDPGIDLADSQSSVPDLTAMPDPLIGGFGAPRGAGAFVDDRGVLQSSVQTPSFNYAQFGLAATPRAFHSPANRMGTRREATLHERLMLRSYGSRAVARNLRIRPRSGLKRR